MFKKTVGVNKNGNEYEPGGIPLQPQNTPNVPIIKQATNFVKSVIHHVANGAVNVPDEEQKKRMDICRACDQFIENNDNPRCNACGCYLKIKTSWASEKCPQDKWLPILQKPSGCPCNEQ